MADLLSVERHIRDVAQELRVIEQDINIWMMQLAKGGQPEIITRDIEAALAERKDISVAAGPTTLRDNHLNSCGTVEHAIDLGVTSAVSIPPTCG